MRALCGKMCGFLLRCFSVISLSFFLFYIWLYLRYSSFLSCALSFKPRRHFEVTAVTISDCLLQGWRKVSVWLFTHTVSVSLLLCSNTTTDSPSFSHPSQTLAAWTLPLSPPRAPKNSLIPRSLFGHLFTKKKSSLTTRSVSNTSVKDEWKFC